jgi:hypothetical protein
MSGSLKFTLLTGVLALVVTATAALLLGKLSPGRFEAELFIIGALSLVPFSLGSYLASKYRWLALDVTLKRSAFSSIPLVFSPIAFLLGMVGWGDIQEHWVRGFLHHVHRELPEHYVGLLVFGWFEGFGAIAVGFLIWVSISALTRLWKLKTLIVICAADLLVAYAIWLGALSLNERVAIHIAFTLVVFFCIGCLLALAIKLNITPQAVLISFRVAASGIVVGFLIVAGVLTAHSTPERQLPLLSVPPLWSADLAQYGCRPQFMELESAQISFTGNQTLGITMSTSSTVLPDKKWKYQDCILSLDATNGHKIAQAATEGFRPIISGNTDGTFTVSAGGNTVFYDRNLVEARPALASGPSVKTETAPTAAHSGAFRSDQKGNLWFTRNGKEELLVHYPCGGAFIYTLSETRTLVLACARFSLFDASGKQLMEDGFVREGLKYAALSRDHRYFLLTAYLWEYGDPSYLEEEKILICDTETGRILAAIKSDPLPRQQSWLALSEDSSLLAVSAGSNIRVYRLPSLDSSVSNPPHSNVTNY